jgi:hypothetical protein
MAEVIARQNASLASLQAERDTVLAERDLIRERGQFGRRGLDPDQLQLGLEDLEQTVAAAEAAQEEVVARNRTPRSPRVRRRNLGALPAHLPRVDVLVDLEDKNCRCCRPIALGRKNALIAGSDGGARHWAIVASLVATAKLNGVEPLAWLTDVLERMVSGRTKAHELKRLLPTSFVSGRTRVSCRIVSALTAPAAAPATVPAAPHRNRRRERVCRPRSKVGATQLELGSRTVARPGQLSTVAG